MVLGHADSSYQTTNLIYSLVIWKDYNCARWITLDPFAGKVPSSSYSSADSTAIINALQSGISARNVNDIWKVAQDIQGLIPLAALTSKIDKDAFTIVASQLSAVYFMARLCVKDYIQVDGIGTTGLGS
jgi:hypothetical protein